MDTLERPVAEAAAADRALVADLNYLEAGGPRPVTYTYEPPPGVPWRTGTLVPTLVRIADGRPDADRFTLDAEGFAFLQAPTTVADFDDDGAIRRVYYPEAEDIVRRATGAALVLAFDHNLRSAAKAERDGTRIREPVKRVHNDFTATSGPDRARKELAAAGLDPELLREGRFALVNLWRPVRRPVQTAPLAVCDARSIAQGDWVAQDLVYRDRVGETYAVTHNPAHRWVYFPAMRPDEALLIKCFDSDPSSPGRYTAHAAFDDPTSPPEAPVRESIEVRTLVLYGPSA